MSIWSDIPEFTEVTISGVTYKQINFASGAKRTHRINVVDSSGAAQAMSGWTLAYVWRAGPSAVDRLIFSKATGGSGITVGNGSGTNDRATVTIDRADVIGVRGKVWWSLYRTDGTDDDVLAAGTLMVVAVADQP